MLRTDAESFNTPSIHETPVLWLYARHVRQVQCRAERTRTQKTEEAPGLGVSTLHKSLTWEDADTTQHHVIAKGHR